MQASCPFWWRLRGPAIAHRTTSTPSSLQPRCRRLRAQAGVARPLGADLLAAATGLAPARAGALPDAALDTTLAQLRSLLGANPAPPAAKLSVIQAGVGAAIRMVKVDDVLYFEAADKYVRLVTPEREHLIRISLRELLPQLDMQRFWRIHRGTVVRADAVATALRDESGKLTLSLRGHPDKLAVGRLYTLFKGL